jgi:hypothetical protein
LWNRLFFLGLGLALLTLSGVAGFCLGTAAGQYSEKLNRFEFEKERIASILAADPVFAKVEPIMYTGNGQLYLQGEVPTRADLERLRSKMVSILGTVREVGPTDGVSTSEELRQLNRQMGKH